MAHCESSDDASDGDDESAGIVCGDDCGDDYADTGGSADTIGVSTE